MAKTKESGEVVVEYKLPDGTVTTRTYTGEKAEAYAKEFVSKDPQNRRIV